MSDNANSKHGQAEQSPTTPAQLAAEGVKGEHPVLNLKRDNPWFSRALYLGDIWQDLDFM